MNSNSNNAAWNDFNDAEEQREFALIPPKTLAKVIMAIRPGGYDDVSQGWTGGYRLIQLLLGVMSCLPCHRLQTGDTRFEEGLPLGIDGQAFLRANHKRAHPVTVNAALVGESLTIEQLHQAHELVCLALVRRRGQQQKIGRSLGQRRT